MGCSFKKIIEVVLILNLVASNSGCEPDPVSVLVVYKSKEALSKDIKTVCSWLPEGSQVTLIGRNLTTLNHQIEDALPEKNDGKGMAKIVIIFSPLGKVDFLDGGWNLRRMTFVVTSKLSDIWTKIASDDKHIVQTPLNDSIKDTFKAVLCEDLSGTCQKNQSA